MELACREILSVACMTGMDFFSSIAAVFLVSSVELAGTPSTVPRIESNRA